jgi:hypothetical protein
MGEFRGLGDGVYARLKTDEFKSRPEARNVNAPAAPIKLRFFSCIVSKIMD